MSESYPVTERKTIAGRLANSDRPTVFWNDLNGNPCCLNYLLASREGRTARFYELIHVADASGLDGFVATRYLFREDGTLVRVFDNVVLSDEAERDEVDYETMFAGDRLQAESGLSLPDENDEAALNDLLRSGVDNPSLTEEVPDV